MVPVFVLGNGSSDGAGKDRKEGKGDKDRVIEFAKRKNWNYGFSFGNSEREEILTTFAKIC